ncbi:MAG: aminodeoxychorismate synthase component I [Candidatus Hydrogenedentes bacterium]|nr:aminodeoxychorismate synthase component I [Candidatus Hydrogenedentota bacterium]
MKTSYGRILFPEGDSLRVYESPIAEFCTARLDEVRSILAILEQQVIRGYHVAGYITYEAAPAFDPAIQTHTPRDFPLLWFGVYREPLFEALPTGAALPQPALNWKPSLEKAAYGASLARIREHIAAGDTYQVNFTYPFEAHFDAEPEAWFLERLQAQQCGYAAYLDLGDQVIMSLSPELFFELNGERITTRPMKGTRPRGLGSAEDRAMAEALRNSPKERAENLMIVDMLRNDLGRVCAVNSIEVPTLFSIERYPTVWQMTSTVTGHCDASVPDIFAALFPCASVTGAPKIETMKIIRELEAGPRGVYCGAIGWWAPGRQARFNVAIRTATLDRDRGLARYAAGSGIVWDSEVDREYQECEQKTAVLYHTQPPFALLASLRLEASSYFLLEEHLDRLADSAEYFGYAFGREKVRAALEAYRAQVERFPTKVRVLSDKQGVLTMTDELLPAPKPWKVGLARSPIDSRQPWTHHKTTHRALYDSARATRPDCTDVLLWTADGALTESTFANIVLRFGDKRYTPPSEAGLLPGVFRRHLLETSEIEERKLTVDDLAKADEVMLINSVRGWIEVEWVALSPE